MATANCFKHNVIFLILEKTINCIKIKKNVDIKQMLSRNMNSIYKHVTEKQSIIFGLNKFPLAALVDFVMWTIK